MGLGEFIKNIRIQKGISQAEACMNATSQSNFSKFELEKIELSANSLFTIIYNLDLSLEEFCILYEKEFKNETNEIITKFLSLSANQPNELIYIRNRAINYLKETKVEHPTLYNVIQLSYALESIAKEEKYDKAISLALPIWSKLQKRDRWYIREITLLNNILYIFPFETAEEILKRSINILKEYPSTKSITSLQLNLYINISLLSIKSKDFTKAVGYLNLAIKHANQLPFIFYKKISQMRLAYCKANLAEHFEEDLMSIVMYFASTNSLSIYEQLKGEAEKYCTNTDFLLTLGKCEQKVKALL